MAGQRMSAAEHAWLGAGIQRLGGLGPGSCRAAGGLPWAAGLTTAPLLLLSEVVDSSWSSRGLLQQQ